MKSFVQATRQPLWDTSTLVWKDEGFTGDWHPNARMLELVKIKYVDTMYGSAMRHPLYSKCSHWAPHGPPIPPMIFQSNYKFNQSLECWSQGVHFTHHDNNTIVTCTKCHCHLYSTFVATALQIFEEFKFDPNIVRGLGTGPGIRPLKWVVGLYCILKSQQLRLKFKKICSLLHILSLPITCMYCPVSSVCHHCILISAIHNEFKFTS